jgi:hypothetical protein
MVGLLKTAPVRGLAAGVFAALVRNSRLVLLPKKMFIHGFF